MGVYDEAEYEESPEEHIARLSDGALVQAVETTMAARRRTQHLLNLLPEGGVDLSYVDTKAADAEERLRSLESELRHEGNERGLDLPPRA